MARCPVLDIPMCLGRGCIAFRIWSFGDSYKQHYECAMMDSKSIDLADVVPAEALKLKVLGDERYKEFMARPKEKTKWEKFKGVFS